MKLIRLLFIATLTLVRFLEVVGVAANRRVRLSFEVQTMRIASKRCMYYGILYAGQERLKLFDTLISSGTYRRNSIFRMYNNMPVAKFLSEPELRTAGVVSGNIRYVTLCECGLSPKVGGTRTEYVIISGLVTVADVNYLTHTNTHAHTQA